uniref:Neprilysin-11-like isoform X4 n=1 Tax=Sogatella furcifera TaxID=113103 RepID=A0A2S1TP67_SOGFU|nr:neprilysin-11-like isoform X4 [Sogatella furcifera]
MSNTTIIKNPTWWRRRTMLERGLTVITAVAFLACVLLACALSTILLRESERKGEKMPSAEASVGEKTESIPTQGPGRKDDLDLCLTPGCVATANSILQNMDRKVDPCDNFYEFACGKFVEESRIPDDKSSLTTFSVINDKLQEQLRDILDQPISDHDIKPFVYAKNLYKSCMNKTLIEEKGAKPVLSILKELGGWPVLEGSDWNEAEWDWKKSVYTFREKGFSVDYFLDFSVGVDLKNSTVRVIDLDQATLAMSREYLVKGLSDKLVAAYFDYMVDIAVLYGADKNVAKTELRKSLDFEISLANMSLPLEERRNATKLYNPMTLPELQQKFPSIPWTEYFTNLLPDKIKLRHDEFVIVNVPTYIHKLEALMSNTPKRVQANYALWRAAGASVSYLSDNFRRRQLEYSTVLSGRTEIEARWKECTDVASGSLSLAVGSQYVRKFFKEDAKKNAEELVLRVRKEMYKILEHVDWMDEKNKGCCSR